MRIIRLLLIFCCLSMFIGCSGEPHFKASVDYKIVDGQIVLDEPAREAGQESMLAFAADPIDVVRVGFVGLGMRGPDAVSRFTFLENVEIKALCDKYPDRASAAQSILTDAGLPPASEYSGDEGYKELCERDDIDLVYICTSWQMHVPIALYALSHGKHVAIEVPSANNVADCWRLVDASEKYRRHCMILENCCYDFFEMTTLNMAQHGVFGEILHVEGAYIHNLEPYWEKYADNWRLSYNQEHNGDVYATHGIGPDCQVLNIHRGDKLDYLVSMSTRSVNSLKMVKKVMGDSYSESAQGDQINTLIRTHNGCTIDMQHNVMTNRPYSRMYQVVGTDGFANKYPVEGYSFSDTPHRFASAERVAQMRDQYQHPIQKEVGEIAKKVGGHGGMDFIMDYRLIYCLHHGLPLDMDVYDAAEWSSMGELTAISIANGSMPVRVPDFTRGEWDKLKGLKFYYAE